MRLKKTRLKTSTWSKSFSRGLAKLTRSTLQSGGHAVRAVLKEQQQPPPGPGDWLAGVAMGPSGMRRYRLYRPPEVPTGLKLPLLVMLHGCNQTAKSFAISTRMNRIAAREQFFVLYPEQDRLANPQGCWNWYEIANGRAYGEAALILAAIDQVSLFYPVDRARVAVAGMSAGASMAALLAAREPARFKAVAMHSGIAPGMARSGLSALGAMHGHHRLNPSKPASFSQADTLPPLLVIQGGGDVVVASSNGAAAAELWAEADGARAGPARLVQRGNRYPLTRTDYTRAGRTVATLLDVPPLGHAWSGGAASAPFSDCQGPDASRLVWSFVARRFGPPV